MSISTADHWAFLNSEYFRFLLTSTDLGYNILLSSRYSNNKYILPSISPCKYSLQLSFYFPHVYFPYCFFILYILFSPAVYISATSSLLFYYPKHFSLQFILLWSIFQFRPISIIPENSSNNSFATKVLSPPAGFSFSWWLYFELSGSTSVDDSIFESSGSASIRDSIFKSSGSISVGDSNFESSVLTIFDSAFTSYVVKFCDSIFCHLV